MGVSRDSASSQEARGQAVEVLHRMPGSEDVDESRELTHEQKLEATYEAMLAFKRQKREEDDAKLLKQAQDLKEAKETIEALTKEALNKPGSPKDKAYKSDSDSESDVGTYNWRTTCRLLSVTFALDKIGRGVIIFGVVHVFGFLFVWQFISNISYSSVFICFWP